MVMDAAEKRLERETRKWLEKIGRTRSSLRILGAEKRTRSALENADSYISDCGHWIERKDFVLAFEAVVYAWGILETLESMGFVEFGKQGGKQGRSHTS